MLLLVRDMVLDQGRLLHRDVRSAAAEVIRSMTVAGHGDSVYLVLEEAVRGRGGVAVAQTGAKGAEEDVDEEERYGLQACMDILAFMETHAL